MILPKEVIILVRVNPWEHIGVGAISRIKEEIRNYKDKGFDTTFNSATNGRLKYIFIPDHQWEVRIQGMMYDDVINGFPCDNSRTFSNMGLAKSSK